MSGASGWSKSIEDSKLREVFLSEYITNKNPIYFGDSLMFFSIEQSWIERGWTYKTFNNYSQPHDKHNQLLIKVDADDMMHYGKTWYITPTDTSIRGMTYRKGILAGRVASNIAYEEMKFHVWKLNAQAPFPTRQKTNQIATFVIAKR